MENRWSEENYSFRIYSINKKQVEEFERIFPKLNFKIGQLRRKNNIQEKIERYTILIKLSKRINYAGYILKIIEFIKQNKIPKTSYGLWISLSENRDHGGLTVPEYATDFYNKIYSEIGGQLDFSYIFLDI
jgi:hypothetical protein